MRKFTWVCMIFAVVFLSVFNGTGACHSITNVKFSPASPAILPFNQMVDVSFNYSTDYDEGVRIHILPFTNGSQTPNYAVSGSPLYPAGDGMKAWAYFTIRFDEATVDQIRFKMYKDGLPDILLESFVPVQYQFGDFPNSITNIQFSPPWHSPADMASDERVEISFDYATDEAGGVRIFAMPFTKGAETPNSTVSDLPLYPVGSGSEESAYITIKSGDVTVDQIRFQMTNANQTQILREFFRTVQYNFSGSDGGGGGGGGGCFIYAIKGDLLENR